MLRTLLLFLHVKESRQEQESWGNCEDSQTEIYPVQNWSQEMPLEPFSRPQPHYWIAFWIQGGTIFSVLCWGLVIGRAQFLSVPALDKRQSLTDWCMNCNDTLSPHPPPSSGGIIDFDWSSEMRLFEKTVRNPTTTTSRRRYCNTPPICVAPWALRKWNYHQYSLPLASEYASHLYCNTPSHLYGNMPPICMEFFGENTGGRGRRLLRIVGLLSHGSSPHMSEETDWISGSVYVFWLTTIEDAQSSTKLVIVRLLGLYKRGYHGCVWRWTVWIESVGQKRSCDAASQSGAFLWMRFLRRLGGCCILAAAKVMSCFR